MDEGDQNRQLIDEQTEGTGRLRGGVENAQTGVEHARLAVEDAGWFLREHFVWPVEDSLDRLGRRGAIGIFGGGGIAVAGVVAALVIAGSGGSGSSAGTTEAFVTPQRSPAAAAAAAAPTPKPQPKASKPTGPTLHGAPPDFSPAKDVRSGVGDGEAIGGKRSDGTGGTPAERGAKGSDGTAASASADDDAATASRATASNDTPAATAKIGATPAASASGQAQADDLATASSAGVAETATGTSGAPKANPDGANGNEPAGPPAPKAAKRVARRFAQAFVVYEVGGIDTKVRKAFGQTSTKQLSRSLLHRPPRQPASVKVPRAKVVNVVAGPSKGKVYTVSVSLLRVGVTSELRLEMEQGVGKKWQVTNVLG
jgi:hypothetical protein